MARAGAVEQADFVQAGQIYNSNQHHIFALAKIDSAFAGEFGNMLIRADEMFAKANEQNIMALEIQYDSLVIALRDKQTLVAVVESDMKEAFAAETAAQNVHNQNNDKIANLQYRLKRTFLTTAEKREEEKNLAALQAISDRSLQALSNASARHTSTKYTYQRVIAEVNETERTLKQCARDIAALKGESDGEIRSSLHLNY